MKIIPVLTNCCISGLLILVSCNNKNNTDNAVIERQRRQIDSLTALVKEEYVAEKTIVEPATRQIRSYSTKQLVTFLKNELDNNRWAEAFKKDINGTVVVDEKAHLVTVSNQMDDRVVDRIYYMDKNKAEYDKSLSAYVIRGVHDQLHKKIVALVFSSLDFSQLKYVGIIKLPDSNGYLPLWLYRLQPIN